MADSLQSHPEVTVDVLHTEFLNAGVFFVSKSLYVVIYNELAQQLLNATGPLLAAAPLASCIPEHREEYHVIRSLVLAERELRDVILTWEVDGRMRHVLVDSFVPRKADGAGGMYIVMKDLGNLAALEQHMQRTDKLATTGKIAAGIAHEIRNPLTTVKGFLQMLERRFAGQDMGEELAYTEVMLREIERVNGLVGDLLLLSRPHKINLTVCSLSDILRDIAPVIESEAHLSGVVYERKVEPELTIFADVTMFKQAILNLVKNALEAMEHGGTLRIVGKAVGSMLQVDVSDTGPGIPYYQMDKIFDPFYTTKDKGTGLGLPICQRILADHGGQMRVASKGYGSTFTILVPLWQGRTAADCPTSCAMLP